MKKSGRENWKQEMFSLVTKWQDSGINQRDFCDRHDLSIYTFHYWLRRYKQEYSSSENGFMAVEVNPEKLTTHKYGYVQIIIHYYVFFKIITYICIK